VTLTLELSDAGADRLVELLAHCIIHGSFYTRGKDTARALLFTIARREDPEAPTAWVSNRILRRRIELFPHLADRLERDEVKP